VALKDKSPDPRALDLRGACADALVLEGRWPLAGLARLAESLAAVPVDEAVLWRAAAQLRPVTGGEPERWLHLRASTTVPLQCQRCLGPLAQPIEVDRRFLFVADEDEAERLDEESEDDVLVLQPRLNLGELLEDELILALPIVPRHEGECPEPLRPAGEDDTGRPHPFAALAALRKGPG
jgi:uncharacterized protein